MILAMLLAGAPFQDNQALDRAVAAFTGQPAGAEGGARTPVDTRLKLASCPTVSLSWRTAARDAVTVACTGPDWRIYVPVKHSVPIAQEGAGARPEPRVAAKAAPVIKRGDPVLIEAGSRGFSISREGLAMGDAAPGGRFLIRVEDGRTPVQAIAVDSGRATLPGWGE